MKKKVLITGGFGYLGGRIAIYLAREAGYNVVLTSRNIKLPPSWLPEAEIFPYDLLDTTSLSNIIKEVEVIVHLAGMNENDCKLYPVEATIVNTLGTKNILNLAINNGVKKFIYFSTAHVYGSNLIGHITEEVAPNPINPYAISHFKAEDYVLNANEQKKIIGIVFRLSNGFGVPAYPEVNSWNLLVNNICRQIAESNKIVLRTNGMQKRDFITLEDVSRGVHHFLELSVSDSNVGLFNFGGNSPSMSIMELTMKIASSCNNILNFYPEISTFTDINAQLVNEFIYDSTKLKNTGFCWMSNVDSEIERTLMMTFKYFRLI